MFKKFIPEAIVIVASVLLAFWIEAWWDSSQRRTDERELLAFIVEEMDVSIDQITQRLSQTERDQSSFLEFYTLKGSELSSVPWGDASRYFTSLYRPITVGVMQSTYIGIVSTGRISLIQNANVRNALEDLAFEAGVLARRNVVMSTSENAALFAVSKHNVFQLWNLNYAEDLPYNISVQPPKPNSDYLDLEPVRADQEVIGMANALYQQRRVFSRFIAAFRDSLEETKQIIKESQG